MIFATDNMAAILSHPEWNKETGGLEVAKAFADQIKGKSGKSIPRYLQDRSTNDPKFS